MRNLLSIDVEDYFNVSLLSKILPPEEWEHCPSFVVKYTERILEILDWSSTKATFFILGWIATHHPGLVKEISRRGHEIGSHSNAHRLVYAMTPSEFREDTRRCKEILEDITGAPVFGYRAPSFSIIPQSAWAYPILMELGFSYSSSTHPIHHDLYGNPNGHTTPHFVRWEGRAILEIPISTVRLAGQNIPFSGGGYLRFLPYEVIAAAIRKVNLKYGNIVVAYLHPWEINPEQPRYNVSLTKRFRHYLHLATTDRKLWRLVDHFAWGPLHEYVVEQWSSQTAPPAPELAASM
jgi:polysaccharide deacetylase family protein (PEP-CTERM system associated)